MAKETSKNELKILCPFCSKPWTARMEQDINLASEGCDICGFGRTYSYVIKIYCEHCGKLIYVKEGEQK